MEHIGDLYWWHLTTGLFHQFCKWLCMLCHGLSSHGPQFHEWFGWLGELRLYHVINVLSEKMSFSPPYAPGSRTLLSLSVCGLWTEVNVIHFHSFHLAQQGHPTSESLNIKHQHTTWRTPQFEGRFCTVCCTTRTMAPPKSQTSPGMRGRRDRSGLGVILWDMPCVKRWDRTEHPIF